MISLLITLHFWISIFSMAFVHKFHKFHKSAALISICSFSSMFHFHLVATFKGCGIRISNNRLLEGHLQHVWHKNILISNLKCYIQQENMMEVIWVKNNIIPG